MAIIMFERQSLWSKLKTWLEPDAKNRIRNARSWNAVKGHLLLPTLASLANGMKIKLEDFSLLAKILQKSPKPPTINVGVGIGDGTGNFRAKSFASQAT